MDTPRIVAINDVHLVSPSAAIGAVDAFYGEYLGLLRLGVERGRLTFRGYPNSGPRLVVEPAEEVPERMPRRQAVIQVASLRESADELIQLGFEVTWSRGLFYYDRRLLVMDPGGNLIELISRHLL